MTGFHGEGVGAGGATGPAFWVSQSAVPETTADRSPETERARFERARERVFEVVRTGREFASTLGDDDGADVLATHETLLSDPALEERIEDAIEAGDSAERAIGDALDEWIATFEERGGRTATRADDLRDVRGRLLSELDGENEPSVADTPDGAVILAERLTPQQAVRLDAERVAGVATVAGSPIAHAAIIARSRGVPCVVGVGDGLTAVESGTEVAVDATDGRVVIGPDAVSLGEDPTEAPLSQIEMLDGSDLTVTANVGSGLEAATASDRGADGVGLFRSEVLAFRTGQVPGEDEQVAAYTEAGDAFPEGHVAVRTFDFGGDKPLLGQDENGPRGIAWSLANPDVLRTQLRAVCRAASQSAGELSLVLPHVTRVEQVSSVRSELASVVDDLAAAGISHAKPTLGAMVETPAAVELAPDIAARVSSLSLGTNDLARHVLGTARDTDPSPTEPAVLRAIERTTAAAVEADVPVRCCGEMAADPDLATLLVRLGVTELSVAPDAIQTITRRLDGLDRDAATALAERVVAASTNDEVAALLTEER
ncbi:putative PEP-binding protein [Halorussus halophilus]|uniref:putative PEP-binding protein n=1 Tax=Halorussus halophilus TaxID=2650975 RepID=UPI001300CC0F|nr:putative PEP-binding protein [Halorussus halophilus]